jgi:RNA polymerase sigma-70 factor (ECF subfamily)
MRAVRQLLQDAGYDMSRYHEESFGATPEADIARLQVARVLELAIDALPSDFRLVFMMRDVEEMSIADTAAALGIREETVKTRLHRARRRLRGVLSERLAGSVGKAFLFLGARCERICGRVLARLDAQTG